MLFVMVFVVTFSMSVVMFGTVVLVVSVVVAFGVVGIMMVFFVMVLSVMVAFSVGVVVFSRWFSNSVDHDAGQNSQRSALSLAAERFARGEITADEFESIRRSLRS